MPCSSACLHRNLQLVPMHRILYTWQPALCLLCRIVQFIKIHFFFFGKTQIPSVCILHDTLRTLYGQLSYVLKEQAFALGCRVCGCVRSSQLCKEKGLLVCWDVVARAMGTQMVSPLKRSEVSGEARRGWGSDRWHHRSATT